MDWLPKSRSVKCIDTNTSVANLKSIDASQDVDGIGGEDGEEAHVEVVEEAKLHAGA